MELTPEQIDTLLKLVANTQPDDLDCDGCLDHIAEFADTELAGHSLCEAMYKVRIHLENCHCCQSEYQQLLEALRELKTLESESGTV